MMWKFINYLNDFYIVVATDSPISISCAQLYNRFLSQSEIVASQDRCALKGRWRRLEQTRRWSTECKM